MLSLFALCLAAAPVDGPGITVSTGLTGFASTWKADGGASGAGKLGFEPLPWLSLYLQGRLGAATVDDRMLTYVSAGLELHPFRWGDLRPHLGLAWAHQHEESLFIVGEHPGSALFGVGTAIRHRGGAEASLGTRYTLADYQGLTAFIEGESNLMWFPDPQGPAIYFAITTRVGLRYAL